MAFIFKNLYFWQKRMSLPGLCCACRRCIRQIQERLSGMGCIRKCTKDSGQNQNRISLKKSLKFYLYIDGKTCLNIKAHYSEL